MTFDPFADEHDGTSGTQDHEPTGQWDNTPPASSAAVPSADGRRVRVTLKGGTAHDAPWVTIDGPDVGDVLDQLTENAEDVKALVDQVAKIGRYFASTGNQGASSRSSASSGGGNGRQGQNKPPHQQAPGGEKRYCEHGEMDYRSGVSKAGNPYKGFFCTAPRGQQCEPQFTK